MMCRRSIGNSLLATAVQLLLLFALAACGHGEAEIEDGSQSNSNQRPSLSGTPAGQVTVGSAYDFSLLGIDPDGDVLSYSITGLPSWASFDRNSGRLFGTPGLSDVGVTTGIVITVSDGTAEDSFGPFSITVLAVPMVVRKYHPGHYFSMNPWDTEADMLNALRPGVAGLQKRYYWNWLEPAFDQYDFAAVLADLDLLASQDKQLVVFIEDKTFNGEVPTPIYLRNDYTLPNDSGGYTAIRWHPYVVERFTKLVDELGQRFDDHPAFEGVAMQESKPGFNDGVLAANGYTPEIYRDALIEILTAGAASLPSSTMFWYMNFFPQRMVYLRAVAFAVAPAGVAVGGPDVLPDSDPLARLVYPYYDEFEGSMTLFNSMQYNSYNHAHLDTSYPTVYWTMDELFQFARDDLHVHYLFWNRKVQAAPANSYMWIDALPTIASNPVFNP